jgi:hypothetical protein
LTETANLGPFDLNMILVGCKSLSNSFQDSSKSSNFELQCPSALSLALYRCPNVII